MLADAVKKVEDKLRVCRMLRVAFSWSKIRIAPNPLPRDLAATSFANPGLNLSLVADFLDAGGESALGRTP